MWIQISRVSHIWVNKLKQNLPVLMSFVWIASISAMPNGVTHCFHFEKLFTKQAEAWIMAKAKQVLSHTCKYHSRHMAQKTFKTYRLQCSLLHISVANWNVGQYLQLTHELPMAKDLCEWVSKIDSAWSQHSPFGQTCVHN